MKKKAVINYSRVRVEKAKAQTEYTEANKPVITTIGADKRKMLQQKESTTKKLAGRYGKPERSVEYKEDKPVSEIQEQRNRLVEQIWRALELTRSTEPNEHRGSTHRPSYIFHPHQQSEESAWSSDK
ncbi:unnamed protein product [Schistosoma mattheei]|uniref:Uncharacterized protein n=1 Tax=Schistosoma mattheei TaxID=31246 RepID=A0A183NZC7_9TREM|nr:unnamed protein product [Schistosoma mattheei]